MFMCIDIDMPYLKQVSILNCSKYYTRKHRIGTDVTISLRNLLEK